MSVVLKPCLVYAANLAQPKVNNTGPKLNATSCRRVNFVHRQEGFRLKLSAKPTFSLFHFRQTALLDLSLKKTLHFLCKYRQKLFRKFKF